MDWMCEDVADRTLRPAKSGECFDLHMAALEWSLIDPIIIESESDIKATNWRERGLKPYHHQIQNLITFCRRLPIALIADDVGLGKTISAGLILSELMSRRRVNRTLVIGPKVLAEQWVGELDEKFGIVAKAAVGAELDAELRRNTPVVVTTYSSASKRLAKLEPGHFDLCILDEAHKLRNLHGAPNPPAMAENVRAAFRRRPFKYVIMLTATPIQNKIWDLYSLVDLLKVAEGKPNPLGTPAEFSNRFLQPGSNGRKLQPAQSKAFRNLIRPNLSRTRRTDAKLPFPVRKLETVRLPLLGAESEMIRLVGEQIGNLNPLLQTSVLQAMMSSPRALVHQAENMSARGSLDASVARRFRDLAARVPVPAKLARLISLLDELRAGGGRTWRAVVFTVRVETQEMIGEALRARGIATGFIRGGDPAANHRTIAGYDAGPPTVHVIVSTDAGAEGINLQKGNVLINYDLPWNPMIVEQRIGRVQRLGSTFANVAISNPVGAGTVEDRIVARLLEKLHGVAQAFGDIEGILEAADLDEDGGGSFESRMRKMVIDALQGRDESGAERLMEKSIEDGARLFDEGKQLLDGALGQISEDAVAHRPLPKIERNPPRMDYRDFVFGAKRADGWTVREIDPTRAEATAPGRVLERIHFPDASTAETTGPLTSNGPSRSYLPGQPAFERLVQHWVDHHSHSIVDGVSGSSASAVEQAKAWCKTIPGCEFVSAVYTPGDTAFQGTVRIKITAGTGVDKFEKLLPATIAKKGYGTIEIAKDAKRIVRELRIAELLPPFGSLVKSAVEDDREVASFCDYYLGRLREALGTSPDDPYRSAPVIDPYFRAKLESDFRPYVQAEVVAVEGTAYDSGAVRVRYKIEGVEYGSELTSIPATRQWLTGLERERCAVTGAVWPIACLGTCGETKRRALLHRLVTTATGESVMPDRAGVCSVTGERHRSCDLAVSAVSGRVAHRSRLIECAESKDLVLPEEAEVSDCSGRTVRADLLSRSDRPPHRSGVEREFGRCDETQMRLLNDELEWSAASGRTVTRELLRPSAYSGRLALPSEMVTCEVTRMVVLPVETGVCSQTAVRVVLSELGKCAASRKPMLKSLLDSSDFSGTLVERELLLRSECPPYRRGLAAEFGRCGATGRRLLEDELGESAVSKRIVGLELLVRSDASRDSALADEMETCQRSGKRVLPGELETCSVTRAHVLRTELKRSDLSGRWALRDHLVRLSDFRWALADEAVQCVWLAGWIPKSEAARCELTGQIFAIRLLNGEGQLAALADLLDGVSGSGHPDPDLATQLRQLDPDLAGATALFTVRSPSTLRAVCGEIRSKGWFRTKVRHFGLLLHDTPETIVLVGRGVLGYRDRAGEFVIEEGLVFGEE